MLTPATRSGKKKNQKFDALPTPTTPGCPPSLSRPRSRAEVRLDGRRQRDDLLLLLSPTLPEVRLNCHSDNFLLLRCSESRMVGFAGLFSLLGVGKNRTNDLAAACLNFHHFENSE